jgi:hypothetical protein
MRAGPMAQSWSRSLPLSSPWAPPTWRIFAAAKTVARNSAIRGGRPCPDRAVLDVHGGLRDAGHRARVNAGFLCQLALRRACERDIGRLKVAAGLRDDPVRAVLSGRISAPRTSSAPTVTCSGKLRREARSLPWDSNRTGSDSSAASSW